jgi:hypothetical protein
MPVTPYFWMIENLALCNWQSVWQSTSRHQMEPLVLDITDVPLEILKQLG